MLRNKKPEPIVTPGARSKAEWIRAGQIVFRELDVSAFRTYDPEIFSQDPFSRGVHQGGRSSAERWHSRRYAMGADIQGAGAHGSGMLRMPHSRHA